MPNMMPLQPSIELSACLLLGGLRFGAILFELDLIVTEAQNEGQKEQSVFHFF